MTQRGSPFHKKEVRECRGLILDANNDWRPVAHPYGKFFNYRESLAERIDWNTAKVQINLYLQSNQDIHLLIFAYCV
jgi:hypothetical protein